MTKLYFIPSGSCETRLQLLSVSVCFENSDDKKTRRTRFLFNARILLSCFDFWPRRISMGNAQECRVDFLTCMVQTKKKKNGQSICPRALAPPLSVRDTFLQPSHVFFFFFHGGEHIGPVIVCLSWSVDTVYKSMFVMYKCHEEAQLKRSNHRCPVFL